MRMLTILACTLTLIAGCQSNPKAESDPVDQPVAEAHDMRGTFDYMSDAAALADMTISDFHFVPHRPMLTPLGEQRLNQLAGLIEAYGGTVHFNTNLTDGELIESRFNAVIVALDDRGVDVTDEVLVLDMPGSEGMRATEAIKIRENEGTYKPKEQAGGAGGGLPGMAGGGAGT